MNKGFIALISSIAVLFILALVLSNSNEGEGHNEAQALLPALKSHINEVAAIDIQQGEKTLRLKKNGEAWIVAEKQYPADFNKIRALLLELFELKKLEAKTKKAESYAKLGVQDITKDSPGKQITIEDNTGTRVTSVILGNDKPGMPPMLYARLKDDPQSWLVSGRVSLNVDSSHWLNKELANVSQAEIKRVEVRHPNSATYSIAKEKKEDKEYLLKNKGKSKEFKSQNEALGIARSLASLNFADVVPAKSKELNEKNAIVSLFDTFDGLRVQIKSYAEKDQYWSIFSASKTDEKNVDTVVQQKIDSLNSKWKDWVYRVDNFKFNAYTKKLDDIVKK
ncbi:MAG: DUF4340 domain-containing protein [Gammaproteobacteria bacterium]|nr:DUF4340 domain-containing protein [Gammaproteobacteria bacterium]